MKRARWTLKTTRENQLGHAFREFHRGWRGACDMIIAALDAPYEAAAGPDEGEPAK